MPFSVPKSTFWDAEDVVCDLLERELEQISPQVHVYTFLPDNLDSIIDSGEAIALVTRVGGFASYEGRAPVDQAGIEVSVLTNSRQDSWQIVGYVRQRFYELSSGTTIGGARITGIDETTAPVEQAFDDPLRRMASFYFTIGIRRDSR